MHKPSSLSHLPHSSQSTALERYRTTIKKKTEKDKDEDKDAERLITTVPPQPPSQQ